VYNAMVHYYDPARSRHIKDILKSFKRESANDHVTRSRPMTSSDLGKYMNWFDSLPHEDTA
jgi:hypothetical protein